MKKILPLLSLLAISLGGCNVKVSVSTNTGTSTSITTDTGSQDTNTGSSADIDTSDTGSTDTGSTDSNPGTTDTNPGTSEDPSTGEDPGTSDTGHTSTETSTDVTTTTTTTTSTPDTPTHRSGKVEVKFAGINDFHGHIEEEGEMVGLAKMATYIKSKKAEGAIFCNSGDMWQETFLSSECKGTVISKAFRTAGVDVNTLGNHDFDWGVEAIRLNEQAEYFNELTLGANIMAYPKSGSAWTKSDLGREYKTFVLNQGTEQEVKVGVVGIIGKDQITSITSKFVEDYIFYDHNQVIKDVSTKLREQENCDIVIASCHTPADQLDSSIFDTNTDGTRKYVDAAFCAHDHAEYASEVNGAPVMEARSYGRLGSEITLTLNLDSGKVEDKSYQNVNLSSLNLKEDAEVKADVDALMEQCSTKGNTVYGKVNSYFSTLNIGRWQAQCAAEKAAELGVNVDYVIVNKARSTLQSGNVNHYKMYETHPFINDLYVVRVSMKDVYGEIYSYNNPFYRVTTNALENDSSKYVTILVYNYLLFHVSVNDETYEKKYNYFYSLNTSGETPTLFTDGSGNKINVLDLTIKDLQSKGSINPSDYSENNWRNSQSELVNAQ